MSWGFHAGISMTRRFPVQDRAAENQGGNPGGFAPNQARPEFKPYLKTFVLAANSK
jgi:hypothetical protein